MTTAIPRFLILTCALTLTLAATGATACSRAPDADPWAALRAKDAITIAITDSGLGGLSVVADAERKLREHGDFDEVDLVFCNALFAPGVGYNALTDRDEKVRVFSRALQGLQDHYAPDVILIACNTLSVIYDDTEFAATTATPVVGIVEGGVDLIAERLLARDDARAILFATRTTVEEDSHRKALAGRGIARERLVAQACPELASYIEQGFDGAETAFLIDAYVADALTILPEGQGPLYVSLNCTHYGYALAAWRGAFAARGLELAGVLNPNTTMIDFLLPDVPRDRSTPAAVTVSAVSMVEIAEDRRASLGRYLRERSPATADALDAYDLVPDLFEWRDVTEGAPSE